MRSMTATLAAAICWLKRTEEEVKIWLTSGKSLKRKMYRRAREK